MIGSLILGLLSLIFFTYPLWRLSDWLGLTAGWTWLLVFTGSVSQFVARLGLRKRHGRMATLLRQGADQLLGVSPVLLGLVLLGEVARLAGLPAFWVALGVLAGVVLAGIRGFLNARTPRVVQVAVHSSKLKQEVCFAQISDVHIGSRSAAFLERVMAQVVAAQPDFLCITGDFVDQTNIPVEQYAALKRYPGPIYFSTGNHEFYEDFEAILARLESLGVRVLRQQTVQHGPLTITGIDDHNNPERLAEVLPERQLEPEVFNLLMYHRPTGLEAAAQNGVDLMISGHTHDGQIYPFNLLVKRQFDKIRGLYTSQNGQAQLYVNQGTGTWGPTMRLGTFGEITVFTLKPESAAT